MAVNHLVKVFFCDGVHLTYGYQGGYCWCKKRKCVPSAYGRKRANLLGVTSKNPLKKTTDTQKRGFVLSKVNNQQ